MKAGSQFGAYAYVIFAGINECPRTALQSDLQDMITAVLGLGKVMLRLLVFLGSR